MNAITNHPRQFNRFYWTSAVLVFLLVLLRSAFVPFAHDEVATFFYYIQSGRFIPFMSHVDAMGHFLLSASSWLCFKLFGSSPLTLRLPLVLSFVVLALAVFKINQLFSSLLPKLVLTSAFIFSYHFIAFYSLARGYGISMAFLLLGLYYFYCYLLHFSFRHLCKFVLFSQLALAANLTLVMVLLVTTATVVFYQLRNGRFLSFKNLLLFLPHMALIAFWVKFGFYLQENGALYYGGGDSYWKVTFLSLIEIMAFKSTMVNVAVISVFGVMLTYFTIRVFTRRWQWLLNSGFAVSFSIMCLLVLAFYLLKTLFGVNFPEDRTGLFFYLFFVLALSFLLNEIDLKWRMLFFALPVFFIVHFTVNANLRVHPWRIYETIPARFYTALVKEQALSSEPLTIGGHRRREFIFGFHNYNNMARLGYMTSPEALQMNSDYAVAVEQDKAWYEKYYDELALENDWGFRLLKRKVPLQRETLISVNSIAPYTGNYEYYSAFEKLDTTFNSINPLIAEFDFTIEKAPVPFNAWLVIEIKDGSDRGEDVYVRVPLSLIRLDWNNCGRQKLCLLTGNIPLNIKRVVCYLWNIDKKDIQMNMHEFRLLRVNGEGVTEISEAKI